MTNALKCICGGDFSHHEGSPVCYSCGARLTSLVRLDDTQTIVPTAPVAPMAPIDPAPEPPASPEPIDSEAIVEPVDHIVMDNSLIAELAESVESYQTSGRSRKPRRRKAARGRRTRRITPTGMVAALDRMTLPADGPSRELALQ